MLFNKKVKRQFCLFGFFIIIILLFLWYFVSLTQNTDTRRLTDIIIDKDVLNTEKTNSNMQQMEVSGAKLEVQTFRNAFQRMDHDPLGVILHIPDKSNDVLHSISSKHHIASSKLADDMKYKMFHRIIHLDLKGAPPSISYLKSIIPLLHSLGTTGLLIEYEDMFPYSGNLEIISAHNAFSKEDIKDLLATVREYEMEVIPLVQTFGHMEFILKLKEYTFLREVPNYPQTICPTNNHTLYIIKSMIDQVMELHPAINWIHIGSDEVYNIAECTRCQNYIVKEDIHKQDLFLRHVVKVAKYIKDSYDVQPLMWDDELRKIPLQTLSHSGVGKYLEIVVWQYAPGILANIGNNIWEKYGEVFNGVWVASAFKGANLPDSFLTDINERLNNNKEWMDVVDLYKGTIHLKGIMLTGWQRFDHFAVLCELLPQAIPSIAISLSYILNRKADHGALLSVGQSLGCDSFINLDLKYLEFVNHCKFPGSNFFEVAQRLYMLKKDIKQMLEGPHALGWVTEHHIKYNFANPYRVEQGLQDLSMLIYEFKKIYTDAENSLKAIYDEFTVHEWMDAHLKDILQKLSHLFESQEKLLKETYWPRRPLKLQKDKEL